MSASRPPKPGSMDRAVKIEDRGSNLPWHLSFLTLGVITLLLFVKWGLGYIGADANVPIFLIATAFGIFMAFNIGGNDVANSFGTSVGAGTLTIKQALLVAAVFEVSGAIIAGGSVTDTVRKGIVDLNALDVNPHDFMLIMMSALLAAALWLLFATKMGYPVSTTHSIVGGIVGAALMLGWRTAGADALAIVQWDKIGQIAASWVLSPVLGGIFSFILYRWIKKTILQYNDEADEALSALANEWRAHRDRHKQSFERLSEIQQVAYTGALARDAAVVNRETYNIDDLESDYYRELEELDAKAKSINAHAALVKWVPVLATAAAVIVSAMMLFKGLHNIDLNLTPLHAGVIITMISASVWMSSSIFVRSLKRKSLSRSTFIIFSWMQVFTAAGFAFSHGSNDIANAIGPFAAIIDVIRTGEVNAQAAVPTPALMAFGVALVTGLWFIGRNVIRTVGTSLTKMHPSSGFAAELAAAMVVIGASTIGLPVSSTHILIGAVLGIGMANRATNWRLMRPIGLAWVITLPSAAALAAGSLLALRAVF